MGTVTWGLYVASGLAEKGYRKGSGTAHGTGFTSSVPSVEKPLSSFPQLTSGASGEVSLHPMKDQQEA